MERGGERSHTRGVVCNDNKTPVEFKWRRGGEELSIVDRYIHLDVKMTRKLFWDAHMNEAIEKGQGTDGQDGRDPKILAPKSWDENTYFDENDHIKAGICWRSMREERKVGEAGNITDDSQPRYFIAQY